MQLSICGILFLLAILRLTKASFYDNPPLELPEGKTPLEELEKKWGTDVRISSFYSTAPSDGYTSGIEITMNLQMRWSILPRF